MADRDEGQPPVALVPVLLVLAPADMPDRRAGQGLVQAVGLGQQEHVLGRVVARIRLARGAAAVADRPALSPARDQPGQLCSRQPGRLAQVCLQRFVQTLREEPI